METKKTSRVTQTLLAASCVWMGCVSDTSPESSAAALSPTFERIDVAEVVGAAFVVAGNVVDNPRPELVMSGFDRFGFGPNGPIVPSAGTVTLFSNAARGNRPNGPIDAWDPTTIVDLSDGIMLPNRPLLDDVDDDGDVDVIVPAGYFFDAFLGQARGSLTWWENRGNGKRWRRHDVVTGSQFAYHSALHADFDGDGIRDLVSVGEDAGNPSDASDDHVELQLFRGLGGGAFAAATTLSDGGGALIEAYDVNGDGLLDIVSPQYFGPVSGQPFVPPFARGASVASFVWFRNEGGGVFTRFAIGTAQGPGFSIVPVANFLGDGVTRWIATNHTNPNVTFPPFALYPEPSVYELTPGADPTMPWAVRTLSASGDFPVTGGLGQAAPGAAAAGDLDGDGRLDLAVSGDGSRAVYWMRQNADGTFVTAQLPDSDGFGQSGGPIVLDLNRSGENEIVFGSFDQDTLAIWSH
ncbi:MAG: VCBS repeat-containing protein [Sandaracinus sp.]|nr:VCBS repeat-containing protein [Sandaracinus sp.]MCB9617968.1 VCBS repeat-containing protein [Sandaracinus sp.]MCB9622487.1 VCBS repeat-containing protein [Sandaracinus sp.]